MANAAKQVERLNTDIHFTISLVLPVIVKRRSVWVCVSQYLWETCTWPEPELYLSSASLPLTTAQTQRTETSLTGVQTTETPVQASSAEPSHLKSLTNSSESTHSVLKTEVELGIREWVTSKNTHMFFRTHTQSQHTSPNIDMQRGVLAHLGQITTWLRAHTETDRQTTKSTHTETDRQTTKSTLTETDTHTERSNHTLCPTCDSQCVCWSLVRFLGYSLNTLSSHCCAPMTGTEKPQALNDWQEPWWIDYDAEEREREGGREREAEREREGGREKKRAREGGRKEERGMERKGETQLESWTQGIRILCCSLPSV